MKQKEPLTVWDLLHSIDKLLYKGKINLQTPLIYSSDDEWNSFQCAVYLPNPLRVSREPGYWERYDCMEIDDSWELTDLSNKKEGEDYFTCLCLN